jgi:hypothetical protein
MILDVGRFWCGASLESRKENFTQKELLASAGRKPNPGQGRIGDNTTATRIEMQSINEDKGILDVPFK